MKNNTMALMALATSGLLFGSGAVHASEKAPKKSDAKPKAETSACSGVNGCEGKDIKCVGGTTCKGHSDCKSATNECKGKNACKGQGWVGVKTKAECVAPGKVG